MSTERKVIVSIDCEYTTTEPTPDAKGLLSVGVYGMTIDFKESTVEKKVQLRVDRVEPGVTLEAISEGNGSAELLLEVLHQALDDAQKEHVDARWKTEQAFFHLATHHFVSSAGGGARSATRATLGRAPVLACESWDSMSTQAMRELLLTHADHMINASVEKKLPSIVALETNDSNHLGCFVAVLVERVETLLKSADAEVVTVVDHRTFNVKNHLDASAAEQKHVDFCGLPSTRAIYFDRPVVELVDYTCSAMLDFRSSQPKIFEAALSIMNCVNARAQPTVDSLRADHVAYMLACCYSLACRDTTRALLRHGIRSRRNKRARSLPEPFK